MTDPSLDRPWTRRADWAVRRVQSNAARSGGTDVVLGAFLVIWVGVIGCFALLAAHWGARDPKAYAAFAGFAAAPLLVSWLTRERSLNAVFEMAHVPAAPGTALEGVVRVAAKLEADRPALVQLSCWRSSSSTSHHELVWETDESAAVLPLDDESKVPIRVEIPATCAASHPTRERGGLFWELQVQAGSGRRRLDAAFEVPVFVTAETLAALHEPPRQDAPRRPESSTTLVDHPGPGVIRFRFPFGSGTTFFTLILPVLSPLLLVAPGFTPAAAVMVPLLVVFGVAVQLTAPAGFEVTPRELVVRRGYRGWFRRRRFGVAEIRRIDVKDGDHARKQVRIHTRGLEDVDVSLLTSVREADWLAAELREALLAAGASLDG